MNVDRRRVFACLCATTSKVQHGKYIATQSWRSTPLRAGQLSRLRHGAFYKCLTFQKDRDLEFAVFITVIPCVGTVFRVDIIEAQTHNMSSCSMWTLSGQALRSDYQYRGIRCQLPFWIGAN